MTLNIEKLTVKNKWKERFVVFQDIERQQQESMIEGEKVTVSPYGKYFSFLAFFFGPFYYMYHRMFKKAWLMLTSTLLFMVVIILVEDLVLGRSIGTYTPSIFLGSIWAMLFPYDYYKKKAHHIDTWPSLDFMMTSTWWCFIYFVLSIIAVGLLFYYLMSIGLYI